MNKKNKRGFTLAEILVVMLVVGFVATIITSSIIKLAPDKEKVMFKKAYQQTEIVIKELINDSYFYPQSETYGVWGFQNTDSVTIADRTYSGASKFRDLFKTKVNILEEGNQADEEEKKKFTTTDNITWIIPDTSFVNKSNDKDTAQLEVDINGEAKPNCSYKPECEEGEDKCTLCLKPDRFTIFVNYRGKVWVEGVKEKEYSVLDVNLLKKRGN